MIILMNLILIWVHKEVVTGQDIPTFVLMVEILIYILYMALQSKKWLKNILILQVKLQCAHSML